MARRCSAPEGWTLPAFPLALDPTPEPWWVIRRQWGGRRYADNWAVRALKADLDADREGTPRSGLRGEPRKGNPVRGAAWDDRSPRGNGWRRPDLMEDEMNAERNARVLTTAAAIAGAADTAVFIGGRRHLFVEAPGRAAGTILGLALWVGLGVSAVAERPPGRRTLALATAVAAANTVLLAAHLRAGVVRPRAFLGAGLAAAALGGAMAGTRRSG